MRHTRPPAAHDGAMPSQEGSRSNDQPRRHEALDIAEYLSTLKAPAGFEKAALPQTDPKTLDDMAFYFETATKTRFDARADLDRMVEPPEPDVNDLDPQFVLRLRREDEPRCSMESTWASAK